MKSCSFLSRFQTWAVCAAILAVVFPLESFGSPDAKESYAEANRLFDQGQFAQAIESYKVAISEKPGFVDAYHNLALAAEMVGRKQAIEAWKRFIEAAEGKEEYKFDVARIRARVQIMERMAEIPDALHPSRYVAEAGDYYWNISRNSEGEEWLSFPVKVYLGSAPQMKWQEGTRQAFDKWAAHFPLQLVARPEQADIRLAWDNRSLGRGHAGEEMEWVEIKREGDELTARRFATISVDLNVDWAKDDMRAIITHELGHALGIKGHSDIKKDIMYMEIKAKIYGTRIGGFPISVWKSLIKEPTARDYNTLIRLYNHPGSSVRFR